MPEAYIRRNSALAANQSNKPQANTIRVDTAANEVKVGSGTSGTTELTLVDTTTAQTLTNKTFSSPKVAVLTDTAGVNRMVPNAVAKTIADGAATSLFEVAIAAAGYAAGLIAFAVFASDGTDHQVDSGIATYSGVNKAGTTTRGITYATANEAKAVSSGTLTLAFTATDDTNKMTVKLQPTGSLTETVYTVVYTVFPLVGTVTIL